MLVLSEKLDVRGDLGERLQERLQKLVEEASGGSVEVDRTADGWMIVNSDDDVLVESIIRLETRINPVASEKPPHLAYVRDVTETKIRLAYPTPRGESVQNAVSVENIPDKRWPVRPRDISIPEDAREASLRRFK